MKLKVSHINKRQEHDGILKFNKVLILKMCQKDDFTDWRIVSKLNDFTKQLRTNQTCYVAQFD